jgi:hypothetical protein
MLPAGILSLPEIEQIKGMPSKLEHLSALLRHLMSHSRNSDSEELLAQEIFQDPETVLRALQIADCLSTNKEDCSTTEETVFESVHCLAQAIDEICGQPQLSRDLVAVVYSGVKKKKEDVQRQAIDSRRQAVEQEFRAREEKLRLWREAQQQTRLQIASQSVSLPYIRESAAARSGAVRRKKRIPVAFLSGAFCLFLAGGTAVAYRDNLWQRIHPMMYGTREQVMPIRAAAERAWLKVMSLDEKQGMDKLRAAAGNLKRDAELLLAQKKYREAEDAFRQFIGYCDELESKDIERNQTKQKQADFQKLRKNVMAERIHQLIPEVWQEAEMMVQSAEKSFNNGSFQDAVMRWDEAARLYENARAIVKHRVMEPAQGRDSLQSHSDDSVDSSEDDSQSSHQ